VKTPAPMTMANDVPVEMQEDVPETVRRLLDLWQRFAAEPGRPTRADLTPFTLKPWLGFIDVYGVENGGRTFRIRLNGSCTTAMTGEDWTGRTAHDVDRKYGFGLHDEVHRVFTSQRPACHLTRIYQKDFALAYRLMLPVFSEAGDGSVAQILLAIFLTDEA